MKLIRHNQFRLRSPEDTDMPSEGLSSRLDAFLAQGDAPAPATPPAAELQVPVGTPAGEPQSPADPPASEGEEEEEEEFPELGAPAARTEDEAFDEAAFDAQTEEESKGMDPKAARKFKELKANLKQLKLETAALKSQAPAAGALPPEIQTELETLRAAAAEAEGLRQRNAELLRVNDEVAVRESPEFIAAVTKPVEDMNVIVTQMAEGAGLDPRTLIEVILETDIAKQDRALDQLQPKLGSRMSNRLERLADDYKAIVQKSEQLLANAPQTLALSRQQREAQEREATALRIGEFKAATETSFKTYAARVPGFTDSSGQLTEIAKATLAKTAAIDPTTLAPADLGYMAFCANAFPEARREIVRLMKENALLKTGKPSGALGGNDKPTTPVDDGQPKGLADVMAGMEFTFNPG